MVRTVLRYPHPLLKSVCRAVPNNRGTGTVRDLVDTMHASPGCVGLAAPQIGEPIRIAVIDVRAHRRAHTTNGLVVLLNPMILVSAGHEVAREGCLSLPEVTADVGRAQRVLITATNLRLPIWSEGFEARAIQHECDHLDGLLILDRLASAEALHRRK